MNAVNLLKKALERILTYYDHSKNLIQIKVMMIKQKDYLKVIHPHQNKHLMRD
jgi:hypothetical protein